jgi:hypothetical protein
MRKYDPIIALKSLVIIAVMVALPIICSAGAAMDEIVIRFEVPRLLQKDISAQYGDNQLYLPLVEIFSLLEIRVNIDSARTMYTGDYLSKTNRFEIDAAGMKAKAGGKTMMLDSTLAVWTPSDYFLRYDLYDSLFNLKIYFDFSELRVYLPLNKDFPAYQILTRKMAHQALLAAETAQKDVARIPRRKATFEGGVADWAFTASPIGGGSHYGNLSLGGMVFGGDLSLRASADSKTGLQTDQLDYRWHYYVENNDYITQANLGIINTTGAFGRNLKGALVTNKPQIERKYFETVNIDGHLGEGWEVELYVNNRLTDFAYTDQNGNYNFLVDIDYGSSRIMLKMFGPEGQMETEERFVSVPYNLIPQKSVEYTLAAGISDNNRNNNKYGQGMLYYGVFDNLTAGFSGDFPIASDSGEKAAVAGEMTYHPLGNLIMNGAFAPGNSVKLSVNYSKPSMIGINSSYTSYYENSSNGRIGQIDNIRFSISAPLKFGQKRLGLRYHLNLDHFRNYTHTSMSYGFSGSIYKFNFNYIGTNKMMKFTSRTDREITSQLILSSAFIKFVRPQVRLNYDHCQKRLSAIALFLNKRIFRTGQAAFSLERNLQSRSNIIMFSVNLFTDFAEFSTRSYSSSGQLSVSQMQRGSIRYDKWTKAFKFDRKNGLGFGTALIWPFLDENYNGLRDAGEPVLPELRAKVGGSSGKRYGKEKLYYYDGLRAYGQFSVQIDPYSLDNPQLQPAHENFLVTVNPNTVSEINIPVVTAGEITGLVDRPIPDGKVGVGGIKVIVINETTGKITEITTFNNGEYYHLGLVPGMYRAYIDQDQLKRYGYSAEPPQRSFQVKTVEGGDYVDNINFTIIPNK